MQVSRKWNFFCLIKHKYKLTYIFIFLTVFIVEHENFSEEKWPTTDRLESRLTPVIPSTEKNLRENVTYKHHHHHQSSETENESETQVQSPLTSISNLFEFAAEEKYKLRNKRELAGRSIARSLVAAPLISSEQMLHNPSSSTAEAFIHPFQLQSSTGPNPSITIEVTPSNDTLITVYFSDIPQDFAVLINLPSEDSKDRSAIYINMTPVSTLAYSGTITFISSKTNSTVGFNIPSSPNNAVITVDVPQSIEVPINNDQLGSKKTKIRLVHLGDKTPFSSVQVAPSEYYITTVSSTVHVTTNLPVTSSSSSSSSTQSSSAINNQTSASVQNNPTSSSDYQTQQNVTSITSTSCNQSADDHFCNTSLSERLPEITTSIAVESTSFTNDSNVSILTNSTIETISPSSTLTSVTKNTTEKEFHPTLNFSTSTTASSLLPERFTTHTLVSQTLTETNSSPTFPTMIILNVTTGLPITSSNKTEEVLTAPSSTFSTFSVSSSSSPMTPSVATKSSATTTTTIVSNPTVSTSTKTTFKQTETFVSTSALTLVTTAAPNADPTFWLRSVIQATDTDFDEINDSYKSHLQKVLLTAYEKAFYIQERNVLGIQQNRLQRHATNGRISVKMINVTTTNSNKKLEMVYYLTYNGYFIPAKTAVKAIDLLDDQTVALYFEHVVLVKAEPYLKDATAQSYSETKTSIVLPVILGAILALLLLILVAVIVYHYFCKKRRQSETSDSISVGQRNRQQTFEEEGTSSITVIGQSDNGKSEAGNTWNSLKKKSLPSVSLQNENNPPPVPSRLKYKRPLPHIPGHSDYSNVPVLQTASSTEKLISRVSSTSRRQHVRKPKKIVGEIYNLESVDDEEDSEETSNDNYNLQIPFPFSAGGGLVRVHSRKTDTITPKPRPRTVLVGHTTISPASTREIQLQPVATQTDVEVQESFPEINVAQAELQMQNMKHKLQAILDDAFSLLKNKKSSPRIQRSNLQVDSASNTTVPQVQPNHERKSDEAVKLAQSSLWADSRSIENINQHHLPSSSSSAAFLNRPQDLPHTISASASFLSTFPVQAGSTSDQTMLQPVNENNADESGTYIRTQSFQDLETQYLIKTIKQELSKCRTDLSLDYSVV